jgi:ATP-dependent RNA helicase DDX49/DBP8
MFYFVVTLHVWLQGRNSIFIHHALSEHLSKCFVCDSVMIMHKFVLLLFDEKAMESSRPQSTSGPSFAQLGLHPWIDKQCAALSMEKPTLVQQLCIPAVLAGMHVAGGAVTGSGKTAAFALPMLQLLSEEMYGVFALILTPSRELAYQIVDQFVALGAPIGARTAVVIGGVPHAMQLDAIKARPHVVVATPGRLKFLFDKFPEVKLAMQNLRFLVLDEADRLTEGDIAEDITDVIASLGEPKPFRQTLLFSATLDSRLTDVSEGLLPTMGITDMKKFVVHCAGVEIRSDAAGKRTFQVAPNLQQRYLFIPMMVKLPYLVALLKSRGADQSTIVFTNSCVRTETVRLVLQLLGFPVASLNSMLPQNHRLNNLAMFKLGIARVLVATDIAARGLDIPDVDMVVHYDVPKLPATYVHRVGRTARAGRSGLSLALVTEHDVSLVHGLERKTKTKMELLHDDKVTDDIVVELLDEVSAAKVQAQVQVNEQFGARAETLKSIAAERRPEMNRLIRNQGDTTKAKRRNVESSSGKPIHVERSTNNSAALAPTSTDSATRKRSRSTE